MLQKIQNQYRKMGINMFCWGVKTCYQARTTERKAISHITKNEKAQGILEYGLIIALVSVGVIVAVLKLKNTITTKLTEVSNQIQTAK